MSKYELGIYEAIRYKENECIKILLTNVSYDECIELIGTIELKDNQFYILDELDDEGIPNGSSWSYLKDGTYLDINDNIYELLGITE